MNKKKDNYWIMTDTVDSRVISVFDNLPSLKLVLDLATRNTLADCFIQNYVGSAAKELIYIDFSQ